MVSSLVDGPQARPRPCSVRQRGRSRTRSVAARPPTFLVGEGASQLLSSVGQVHHDDRDSAPPGALPSRLVDTWPRPGLKAVAGAFRQGLGLLQGPGPARLTTG